MFDLVFTLKNNLFNSFTELRYIMKNSLWRTVDEENFLDRRSIETTEFSWVGTKLSKKLCDKSSDAPRTRAD